MPVGDNGWPFAGGQLILPRPMHGQRRHLSRHQKEAHMYAKILVPLDGSPRAEAILPHATELARRYQAEVILLRVVEIPSISGFEGYDPKWHKETLAKLREEVSDYLEGVARQLQTAGVSVSHQVVNGPVVTCVLKAAEETGADLLAMASHGRCGIGRVFYGSVAAGILHRVDRPLLLIRSRQMDS
jgi:nucleotide-binding universal stress UspA family protein